jgi:hypothetical protein
MSSSSLAIPEEQIQRQKTEKLYLNIKVHHLSHYNIDLQYTKQGRPKQLFIKLMMTNYISTPNRQNAKKQTTITKFYSQDVNAHMLSPLFTKFEEPIQTILAMNLIIKQLRRGKKRNYVRMPKEDYKAKLKELEKKRSLAKEEVKTLLLELFSQ